MMRYKGVYIDKKKDGTSNFRASFTYKNRHISLGGYSDAEEANKVYMMANQIAFDDGYSIDSYSSSIGIPFEKYVIILNFRDNNMYFSKPIYMRKNYFSYYLSETEEYKFSIDDLFYYMNHKICRRGGHLYVNDYGMQISLGARYGIKNYAIIDKDYCFANGDSFDYRYENLKIINIYNGVEECIHLGKNCFRAKLHLNGNIVIGYYENAFTAAIAYNKAIDVLKKLGCNKNYETNYIEEISSKSYADIYSEIVIDEGKLEQAYIAMGKL